MAQTTQELSRQHGIEGILTFKDVADGMVAGQIESPACKAEFFLHGAHVTRFQPTGHKEVLFVSDHAVYRKDKAIRGGVPICFPWFGAHSLDAQPSHGWARISEWKLVDAALQGEAVRLQFSLDKEPFSARYEVLFANALTMRLTVTNNSAVVQRFECALHSYFTVSNAADVEVTGLESASFVDQLSGELHTPANEAIRFSGETDRIYTTGGENEIAIVDRGMNRRLIIARENSQSVVVWNPWIDKSARMSDFGDSEWTGMCCVETANIRPHDIEIAPGDSHTTVASHRAESL